MLLLCLQAWRSLCTRTQVSAAAAAFSLCVFPPQPAQHPPTPPDRHTDAAISSLTGDPNSNWAWFENQKKVAANVRLRFSLGSADDTDGLEESSSGFTESRWAANVVWLSLDGDM